MNDIDTILQLQAIESEIENKLRIAKYYLVGSIVCSIVAIYLLSM